MVMLAAALGLQAAAAWQPLPLDTAIPPLIFVCRPQGETRPDFRRPWWQIEVARTDAVNKARIHQVGRGHISDQGFFDRALTAYEFQDRAPGQRVWRISYASGRQSLVIEYSPPVIGGENLSFVWRRPQGVMQGTCAQMPNGTEGWERNEDAWR